jgi:protein TonB
MAGIIGFHVVLVYLLASGLGATVMNYVSPPIDVLPLEEQKEVDVPPPPPPPILEAMTKIDAVPPIVDVDVAPDGPPLLTRTITDPPPVTPPPVVAKPEPIRLVGKNVLPSSEDYYPPTARRDGAEGAANVQVCVDERGKRQGEPVVTQSSGDARLDKGAIALARDGRYARSMRGDAYVPNCFGFRVIFTMQK